MKISKLVKLILSSFSVFIFLTVAQVQASTEPIQTISGEVSTTGLYKEDIEKENIDWKSNWLGLALNSNHGGASDYAIPFSLVGNSICGYPESRGTFCLEFDNDGNFVKYTDSGRSKFCVGDDINCKNQNYAQLKVKTARVLGCSFNCNQTNKYSYNVKYETTNQGVTETVNPAKSFKCEEIKATLTPQSEWFSSLAHACGYQGGGEKVFTIDPPSPPTNLINCPDQASCLSQATEYNLTPTTWAKGVQKVPASWVESTQNSLSSASPDMTCSNGKCSTLKSGKYTLSLNIPETTYYGQCRGSATDETVEGKTITSPAVTINTDEAKIPAQTSTLDITVQNRPPTSTVTFEKKYLSEGETTKVYCDVIDPDSCSDKIVKIKWKCMDSQGQTDNCFFLDSNSVFRQGELFKEITPQNPYRDTVDLKLNKKETYSVTCEAWDNDNANTLSGAGINSIKVTDPVCIADGTCNGKCPGDPDCGVIPAGSCYVTRIKPAFDIKKIKPNTKVTFEAKIFGSVAPQKYTWFCDKNETAQTETTSSEKTINHTCTNYTLDNYTYEPKAIVTYPNGETKECINNEGTSVITDGIAPNQVGFCVVVPDEGGTDNSACGDQTTAKFKVYTNYDLDNPTYQWSNCPGAENKSNVSCNYQTSQLSEKFTPALTILNDKEEIKCPSNTAVTLYKEASCKVLSRVKGSGEDYAKNPPSRVSDVLESKIERKCLTGENTTTWEIVGSAIQSSDNNSAQTQLNAAGNVTIKAKVKVGDKFVNCEESSTDVKQKLEEGV